MKKHILVLLFLLLALIITCVYQKTYTVYAQLHGEDNTSTEALKHEVVIASKENEIATKQQTLIAQPTKSAVVQNTTHDTPSQKATDIQKVITEATIQTKAAEKEVIDYLLSVMKERDIALIQRDEEETKLHLLIKKTLENRRLAIETMHKASAEIEKEHKERLAERNAKAENNTQEKGK